MALIAIIYNIDVHLFTHRLIATVDGIPDIARAKKYGTPVTSLTLDSMQNLIYRESTIKTEVCRTKSSLLVPESYLAFFKSRCNEAGSRRSFFHQLVRYYSNQSEFFAQKLNISKTPRWKTHYQDQDLDLIKVNFLPEPEDWEDLRHLASAFGVSICFIFVFLLKLEIQGSTPAPPQKSFKRGWISCFFEMKRMLPFKRFCKIERILDFRSKKLHRRIQRKV